MASALRKLAVRVDDVEEAEETAAGGAELERLREENRRMAITLGAFSAFLASRGMLEDAWHFIHNVHQMDEGADE